MFHVQSIMFQFLFNKGMFAFEQIFYLLTLYLLFPYIYICIFGTSQLNDDPQLYNNKYIYNIKLNNYLNCFDYASHNLHVHQPGLCNHSCKSRTAIQVGFDDVCQKQSFLELTQHSKLFIFRAFYWNMALSQNHCTRCGI